MNYKEMIRSQKDKLLHDCLTDEATAQGRDAWASDWANSSVFTLDENEELREDYNPVDAFLLLQRFWDAAHATMREIRAFTGLSQREFSDKYMFTERGLRNWESRNTCPVYTRLLLANAVGMFNFLQDDATDAT